MIHNYNNNIYIKEAQEEDVMDVLYFITKLAEYERLSHLMTATKETLLKSIFEEKSAYAIIAYYNKKAVGMALYFYNFSTFIGKKNMYLEDIYIIDEYKKMGIGKKLFITLAKIAIKQDCKRLDFVCLDWNKKSLDFYQKLNAKKLDMWILHRLEEQELKDLSEDKII